MGNCPVCGCKTEELDFVEKVIGEKEEKVCSFCHRQLKSLEGENAPTEAQLRWLGAVCAKEVNERNENISAYLKNLKDNYITKEEEADISAVVPEKPVSSTVQKPVKNHFSEDQGTIEELTKRIAALETEIRALKRKQMIKTIVELGVPFVMLLLLIIIFFASGLADGISQFMNIIESDFM